MSFSRQFPLLLMLWICGVIQTYGVPAKVAIGAKHGVWLKADGSVWTWGGNADGQLGTGGEDTWAPVQVPGLSGVRDIAAGGYFTVAVKSDGTVWAWGDNGYGELGDGAAAKSAKPVPVPGLSGVVSVASSGRHSLALTSGGKMWAWGDDGMYTHTKVPKQVEGLNDVVAVAVASSHSVALKKDGTVWIWGDHGAGDLGNGNYGVAGEPLPLRGVTDATAIAAAYQLTLFLRKDGTVWATGYGAAGQLGNGSVQNYSTKPVQVLGLAGAKSIAGGGMHALALLGDGTVWSWGYNHDGQLGSLRVKDEQSAKPVRSGQLSGVAAIGAGGNHSVAVTAQGVLWTWGQNDGGALGVAEEDLRRSEVPFHVGQSVPGQCGSLFACVTGGNKVIQICGNQDEHNNDKWTNIQYRYGPENGAPELVFPEDPSGPPQLFFSHETSGGDYRAYVRFSTGTYTYRVFSGSRSGAGVEVSDSKGKRIATVACAERPEVYLEYMRLSLPCDTKNPHGAAGCQQRPYTGK